MIRQFLIVSLAMFAGAAAAADFSTNDRRCSGDSADPDIRVSACSWLLHSDQLAEEYIPVAYFNRGNAYIDKGGFDRAIAEFDTAIRLKPDFFQAYNSRGKAYYSKGQYDRAIADYTRTIELGDLELQMPYSNRAIAYLRKGQFGQAIADFETAIRIKPGDAEAYNGLAWLLSTSRRASVRNGTLAVELASRAVLLGDSAHTRDTLAAAYAEVGRFEEAVRELQRAIVQLRQNRQREPTKYEDRLRLYLHEQPYRE